MIEFIFWLTGVKNRFDFGLIFATGDASLDTENTELRTENTPGGEGVIDIG